MDTKARLVVFMRSTPAKSQTERGEPIYKWSVCVKALTAPGSYMEVVPILDSVTFTLHETFKEPTRVIKTSPFKVEEKGWGIFELKVTLRFKEGSGAGGTGESSTLQVPLAFPSPDQRELVKKTEHAVEFPDASDSFSKLIKATNDGMAEGDSAKKRKREKSDKIEEGEPHNDKKLPKKRKKEADDVKATGGGDAGQSRDGSEIDWDAIHDHILTTISQFDDLEGEDGVQPGLKTKQLRKLICDKVIRRELTKMEKLQFKEMCHRVVAEYDSATDASKDKHDQETRMDLADRIEQLTEASILQRVYTLVGTKGSCIDGHFEFDIFNLHAGIVQRIKKILTNRQ